MTEFSVDELRARLTAADPARGISYRHANLAAALDAVLADEPARIRVLRSFQLKMGAAAAAAAVVTTGAISALGGAGSSLPVLNFAASISSVGRLPAASAPHGTMSLMSPTPFAADTYRFVGGPSLSTEVPQVPVYLADASPTDGHIDDLARFFAQLAGTEVRATERSSGTTTVTFSNGDTFSYSHNEGSVSTWFFSAAPTPTTPVNPGSVMGSSPSAGVSTSGSVDASQLAVMNQVAELANLIGADAFHFDATNSTTVDGGVSSSAQESLGGVPVFGATVSAELSPASGFTFISGTDLTGLNATVYPLVSAADAVARVGTWSPSYATGIAISPPCTTCSGGPVMYDSTTTTAVTTVTLDSATLWLVPRDVAGENSVSLTLVPAYQYSGLVDSWTGNFWAVAIDPAYVAAR
jgi:hypothetical protein